MDILKKEISKRRKQVENLPSYQASGGKRYKMGDLTQKQANEYWEKYYSKNQQDADKTEPLDSKPLLKSELNNDEFMNNDDSTIPRAEVIKRLRSRSQPILLYGETEKESFSRLKKLEIEQPELKEGWKNDFQSAMKEVDHELIEEVVKGEDSAGRHDVAMPSTAEDTNWERIEANARLLGEGDLPNRDCDIIREFCSYILTRWGKALNDRDEVTKRSAKGKLEATEHKQTMQHLKTLLSSLEKHTVNADIREHLIKICRLIIIDRDYIRATNAYMEMAIGNAPWPVGVTRSGLHQRPGSAKAYVSNIAHVLNDETQRKYIQAFKRLMTRCQHYFPTDPSKCVEYAGNGSA